MKLTSFLSKTSIIISLLVATPIFSQSDTAHPEKSVQTVIGVDAEFTYTTYLTSPAHSRLDGRRFVISVNHTFSDRWSMASEVEIEHVKVERGIGGEVALEQAVLDYHGAPAINGRIGLLLLPIAYLNQNHDPNMYLSVDRPLFDQIIVPTTWREIGAGLYGSLNQDLDYQFYLTEGLLRNTFDRNGLGSLKQEGSAGSLTADNLAGSDASHPAISAKLNYHPLEQIEIGASAYYQPGVKDTVLIQHAEVPTQTSIISSDLILGAVNGRMNWSGFQFKTEAAIIRVNNSALIFNQPNPIPSQIYGGYAELAFNIFSLVPKTPAQLLPFVRFEMERYTYPSTNFLFLFSPSTSVNYYPFTAGIAWKPLPELILKADYLTYTTATTIRPPSTFHLGMGFAF